MATGLRKPSSDKIRMTVDGESWTVSLYDHPTAKSLLARLPLTVASDDYPGYDEKVLRLDKGLLMGGRARRR